MQNRIHAVDPRLAGIRDAVAARMRDLGDTQVRVAEATGCSQSQISRFLAGDGKRVTDRITALCKYAQYETKLHTDQRATHLHLSHVMRQAIGNNAAAAIALARIIEVLTPFLQNLPGELQPSQEPER